MTSAPSKRIAAQPSAAVGIRKIPPSDRPKHLELRLSRAVTALVQIEPFVKIANDAGVSDSLVEQWRDEASKSFPNLRHLAGMSDAVFDYLIGELCEIRRSAGKGGRVLVEADADASERTARCEAELNALRAAIHEAAERIDRVDVGSTTGIRKRFAR